MTRFTARSVRFKITALATVIVVVLLAVVGIILLLVQQRMLTAAVDDGLRRRVDDLAVVVAGTIPDSLPGAGDDDAAQIVAPDGTVLVASPNLAGAGPVAPDPGDVEVVAERHLTEPDDSFRVLSQAMPSPAGRVIVHVATATDDVSDSVAVLRTSLLVAVPLAVVVLGLVIWWVVGRALEPVDAIRNEVMEITETDLDRRVPVPAADDEISRLAVTMNLMLDRLEDGVSRLQRFVGDASHELRSPLTRIRSELEVDSADLDRADFVATHRSILEETIAMEQMVADLLYLARADARQENLSVESVDLDDLVLAEAERLRVEIVAVDVSRVSAGQVTGDRLQLTRAVRNLASNAARHAAGTVAFDLCEEDGHVVLGVADDGPGVPAAQRDRVFERFARADEARSRDEGGSGLGLAIVRDIVQRHGGTVTVDPSFSDGARFIMRLPTNQRD